MGEIKLVETLHGHRDRAWSVAWNPSGNILASCGADKALRLWGKEGDSWVCKSLLDGTHRRTVRSVSWSPCGRFIATASFDGTSCIWKKDETSTEFECIATLEGHENEVKCTSWSASGSLLATCSRDKSVWIWEVDQKSEDFECASVINAHTQDVKCVIWHPTDEVLASASYDNTIKMYIEEADDWSCCSTLVTYINCLGIDFEKSGERLVSCSDDRTVKIWQRYLPGNAQGVATKGKYPTWKCVCTLSGFHDRPIYAVQWCKLTGLIATACGDDAIRIFREDLLEGGNTHQPSFSLVACQPKAHSQEVNGISWNPSVAGQLASCSDDGEVKLWEVTDAGP